MMARIFLRLIMPSRSSVCLLKFTGSIIALPGGGLSSDTAPAEDCGAADEGCAVEESGLPGAAASCFLLQLTSRRRVQIHNTGMSRARRLIVGIIVSGNRVLKTKGNVEDYSWPIAAEHPERT